LSRLKTGLLAVAAIVAAGISRLLWQAAITEGADHGSNPELSFPVAARWYSGK